MNKGGIWALIGGIIGILLALAMLSAASFFGSYGFGFASDMFTIMGGLGLVFSIIGIVCGFIEKQKMAAGALMIVSGIVVLIAMTVFGVLTFILFLVGGIMVIREARQ